MKDYAAIARKHIHKPQSAKRKPRLLVYSRNKKGKTRLCATAPDVLIFDPEDGAEEETKFKPDVWTVRDWQGWDDAYNYVKREKPPYKWVCLDGLPKIYNSALRYVMGVQEEKDITRKPGFVQQSDWGKANELVKALLWNFHSLRDYGLIITSQERMEEVSEMGDADEEVEQVSHTFVADVPNGCRSALNSIVDLIGRLYVVRGDFERKFKKPDGTVIIRHESLQRRLWIGPHNMYDTGYRSGFVLPDYLVNPTVPKIVKAMREGVEDAS